MNPTETSKMRLTFYPVTPKRWPDLERLFGERGACGGCWCMWWKLTRSQFEKQKGAKNKRALKQIVRAGKTPGLLAYCDGEPIAWCAIEPRENYFTLERSRVLKRVDDQPVWSVVCFFVSKPFRRKGVAVELLRAAIDYARKRGAKIVEGYPVESRSERMPDAFAWTGFPSLFRRAGFEEVMRRSKARPLVRYFFQAR